MVARQLIVDALDAAQLRPATTGQLAAPCVIVEPGDPWSAPERLPRRLTRWRLTAVAGRADTEGAIATLADLIDAVDAALLTVPGLQLPSWAKPFDASLDGIPYAASAATVQLYAEG